MPSLRNILHKRDDLNNEASQETNTVSFPTSPPPPEIRFLRTDTFNEEEVTPPSVPAPYDDEHIRPSADYSPRQSTSSRRSFQLFNRSRSDSQSSASPSRPRRLSNLLHIDRRGSRSHSRDSSQNIPDDLPQIEDNKSGDKQEREAQWEKRATVLAQHTPQFGNSPLSSPRLSEVDVSQPGGFQKSHSRSSSVGDERDDVRMLQMSGCSETSRLMCCYRPISRRRFDCTNQEVGSRNKLEAYMI